MVETTETENTDGFPALPKKSKRGDVSNSKYNWNPEMGEAVISEWKKHSLLYQASHPRYHLKDKQKVALNSMLRNLMNYEPPIDPLPSVDKLVKKLDSLRACLYLGSNKT